MADGARGLAVAAPRPPAPDSPALRLGANEGPLDLLLELARAQRGRPGADLHPRPRRGGRQPLRDRLTLAPSSLPIRKLP
jgi:hypothetical protein